jgi:hypothetical protein
VDIGSPPKVYSRQKGEDEAEVNRVPSFIKPCSCENYKHVDHLEKQTGNLETYLRPEPDAETSEGLLDRLRRRLEKTEAIFQASMQKLESISTKAAQILNESRDTGIGVDKRDEYWN